MAVEIDDLVIEVSAEASSAEASLDKLSQSLGKLKNATSNGAGLKTVITKLQELNTEANKLDSSGAAKVSQYAGALKKLGEVGKISISSSIATQLGKLGEAAGQIKDVDFSKITDLTEGLKSLSEIGNVKISSSIANQLVEIGAALDVNKDVDFSKFHDLAEGLNALANVGKVSLSSTISTNIESIGRAINGLDTRNFESVSQLAEALSHLKEIPKISVSSIAKGLERLAAIDLNTFSEQIKDLTEIMKPFAEEMQSVADGFSAFPRSLQNLVRQQNNFATATDNANTKLSKFVSLLNIAGAIHFIKGAASVIAEWVNESNDYIEDLNLFNAALGEYADEAKRYAEEVSSVMGIDTGEWMRNQGVFMTLTTGFGVASDKAYLMSKNLTQLGYDISSYFNLSIEESMQKLESAIAGELEPVRRIGYDLSKAALEGIIMDTDNYTVSMENLSNAMSDEAMSAFAAAQGINLNYSEMTQAEKSQLRYIALMTQVTNVQGDMARTLNSPANQLRILKSQLQMCARALGNIFIPVLNKVLPILISLAKVIRLVANTIANIFGFELPEVDYSGLGATVSDTTDDITDYYDAAEEGADSASEAAKEYKNTLLGFDELNRLNSTSSSSSSGSGSGSSWDTSDLGSSFDFDLPEYNFLDAINDRVDTLYEKLKEILGLSEDIESNWQNLKIAIDDILFDWDDLTPEQIAEKCVTGLEAFLLGATGFAIAGVPGALVGTLSGVALSIVYSSMLFDHDGELGQDELGRMLSTVLNEMVGFAAGFLLFGSVKGGLITASIAGLITIGFQMLELKKGENMSADTHTLLYAIKEIFNQFAPAAIGFKIAGVKGAAIAMGIAAIARITLSTFSPELKKGASMDSTFLSDLVKVLTDAANIASIVGLGFELGGVKGAAIALVATASLKLLLGSFEVGESSLGTYDEAKEYYNANGLEIAAYNAGKDIADNVETGVQDGASENFSDESNSQSFIEKVKTFFSNIISGLQTDTVPDMTEVGGDLAEGLTTGIENKLTPHTLQELITDPLITEKDNLRSALEIGSPSKVFYSIGQDTVQGLIDGFEDKWSTFKTSAETLFDRFKTWWEGRIVNGWKIKLPHISISYTAASSAVAKILGITQIPHLSVSWYKNGGFPDMGQLFVAREAGPELVGNIGGKSAVANNDQIIEGIRQGVYEAVTAANGNKSGGGSVTLNVNGKQFCRAIYNDMKAVTNEHGISLVNA